MVISANSATSSFPLVEHSARCVALASLSWRENLIGKPDKTPLAAESNLTGNVNPALTIPLADPRLPSA
jgi:hypothetical protein